MNLSDLSPLRAYDPRTAYRPSFVRWMTIILWVLAVGWFIAAVRDPATMFRQLPFVLLFLIFLPYGLFWAPRIDVTEDSAEITNIFRTIRIPFARLQEVRTKYVLELVADDDQAFTVWCAPAGSGRRAIRSSSKKNVQEIRRAMPSGTQTLKSSELPGTDSGNAAILVNRALTAWLEKIGAGFGSSSDGARQELSIRWHVAFIAVLGACVLGCIISIAL